MTYSTPELRLKLRQLPEEYRRFPFDPALPRTREWITPQDWWNLTEYMWTPSNMRALLAVWDNLDSVTTRGSEEHLALWTLTVRSWFLANLTGHHRNLVNKYLDAGTEYWVRNGALGGILRSAKTTAGRIQADDTKLSSYYDRLVTNTSRLQASLRSMHRSARTMLLNRQTEFRQQGLEYVDLRTWWTVPGGGGLQLCGALHAGSGFTCTLPKGHADKHVNAPNHYIWDAPAPFTPSPWAAPSAPPAPVQAPKYTPKGVLIPDWVPSMPGEDDD